MATDGYGWLRMDMDGYGQQSPISFSITLQEKHTRLTTHLDPIELSLLVNIPVMKKLLSPKLWKKKTARG